MNDRRIEDYFREVPLDKESATGKIAITKAAYVFALVVSENVKDPLHFNQVFMLILLAQMLANKAIATESLNKYN